jgi:PIN domain nuclease of toxin-antitoxin system
MKTTTVNPTTVIVKCEIDFHQCVEAVLEFAHKYPVERMSIAQAQILSEAADIIICRVQQEKMK